MVTVREAAPIQVAAQYRIFQAGDKRNLADIEMAVMTVQPEKVSLELLARPKAKLRLGQVQVQLHVVPEFPCVVSAPQIDGKVIAQPYFHPRIRRSGGPKQGVAF